MSGAFALFVRGAQFLDHPPGDALSLQGSRGPVAGVAVFALQDLHERALADGSHVDEGAGGVEAHPPIPVGGQPLERGYGGDVAYHPQGLGRLRPHGPLFVLARREQRRDVVRVAELAQGHSYLGFEVHVLPVPDRTAEGSTGLGGPEVPEILCLQGWCPLLLRGTDLKQRFQRMRPYPF